MAIINRRSKSTAAPLLPTETENFAFAAEIPIAGPAGDPQPLWKVQVQVHSTPQADGAHTRLRAHVQTNLASVLRPALNSTASTSRAALAHDGAPRALRLAERAGHAAQTIAQRALNIPLLRRMAEPLLQLDLNTWIEIQASTASLDRGSHGLLRSEEHTSELQ